MKLSEKDLLLLKHINEPDSEETKRRKEAEEIILDSFNRMFDDLYKKERHPIMLMYLWVATACGITLREACERYYVNRDNKLSNEFMKPSIEYSVSLRPREEPIVISQAEFADYQMEVAKFLQDILDETNKKDYDFRFTQ
jgi:hypothetical protein